MLVLVWRIRDRACADPTHFWGMRGWVGCAYFSQLHLRAAYVPPLEFTRACVSEWRGGIFIRDFRADAALLVINAAKALRADCATADGATLNQYIRKQAVRNLAFPTYVFRCVLFLCGSNDRLVFIAFFRSMRA